MDWMKIQKEMKKIIQANHKLERFELPRAEAIKFMDREEMALAVSKEAGFTKNLTLIRAIQRDDVVTKDTKSYLNIKLTAPTEKPVVYVKNVTEAATASVEPTTPAYNPETPTTGDEGTQNPTE